MSAPPELAAAVVASAMDAVVAVDETQRIVLFNRAAEEMFGCPAAGAIGQPLDRFLPDRFRGMHRRHLAGFTATGGTARAMGHLRPLAALRADGTEFPIEASISRVAVGDGLRLAAIIRDVSVRHALEEALRRQANLLDLAYDAIFTWEWGGAITFWNRGAERLYGYAPEDAIGQVSHTLLRTRHPRGRSAMIVALERDGAWDGELVHVRRDGAEVTVESRHVLVREGGHSFVLEANHDVTDRHRLEAERTAVMEHEVIAWTERDQLQEILDGLPSGVYIVAEPDGRIEFANAAFTELISGRGEQQVEGTPAYGRHYFFRQMNGSALPGTDRPGPRAVRGDARANCLRLRGWTGLGGRRRPAA